MKFMNSWCVVALLACIPTYAAAESDSGGVIGSGGDRLTLSSKKAEGAVVVENPFEKKGKLMVSGEPGAGQGNEFLYAPCEADRNGNVKQFSCQEWITAPLNQEVPLTKGFYMVGYSGSEHSDLVKIKSGEPTVLELRKIEIDSDGKFTFDVFLDYTDPIEQEKALKREFGYSGNISFANILRERSKSLKRDPLASAAYEAILSGNYQNLKGPVLRFNDDASMAGISIAGFGVDFLFARRRYVVKSTNGRFISVFPGIYGIQFKNTDTSETSTEYGIRVD